MNCCRRQSIYPFRMKPQDPALHPLSHPTPPLSCPWHPCLWQHILNWIVRTSQTSITPPSCHALGKFCVTPRSAPQNACHILLRIMALMVLSSLKRHGKPLTCKKRRNRPLPRDAQTTPPCHAWVVGVALVWPRKSTVVFNKSFLTLLPSLTNLRHS